MYKCVGKDIVYQEDQTVCQPKLLMEVKKTKATNNHLNINEIDNENDQYIFVFYSNFNIQLYVLIFI